MRLTHLPALLNLMFWSMPFPLAAAEPWAKGLDSQWEFRAMAGSDRADLKAWHPAQVPGVVHTDLLRNGLIPDPFYRDNDARLQWIGLADWEYRTTFSVEPATLGREHVDLVFDGLDTLAEVYLNGTAVLQADNMFRRWRIPAKESLRPGPNTLRVVFHSPIAKMLPQVQTLPYVLPSVTARISTNELNIATAPYTRKAPYHYGWDWGPRYVTQGIWQPVRVEAWDSLRIEGFHIQQRSISKESASVAAEVEIEAGQPATVTIAFTYEDSSHTKTNAGTQTVQLHSGTNHVSLPIEIAAPRLWHPAGYGAQERYRFTAEVRVGRETAARVDVRTGLRSHRVTPCNRSVGQEFHVRRERDPGVRQGGECHPV